MAIPKVSVCSPWATTDDVCSPCDDYSFAAGLLDDSLLIASDVLFELSGRQFAGCCQDTVRPDLACLCGPDRWQHCRCGGLSEVSLGGYPVTAIDEVLVDGTVLDPSEYRIDDYRWLVRLPDPEGRSQRWPCCQAAGQPTTEVGTWEVTFTYGTPPPPAGVRAAADLACQLALSCQPETIESCTLPQRVTSITRQGVTAVLLDPFDFLDDGKTGIYSVDLFLRTYNPAKLRCRAAVFSPDLDRAARRAGT